MEKKRFDFFKKITHLQLRSIHSKILLLLLFCVVLSSALIGIICIAEFSSVLRDTAENNMILNCEREADTINLSLEKVEEQIETVRHFAETALKDPSILSSAEERALFITEFEAVGKNHAQSAEGVIGVFAVFNTEALHLQGLSEPFGFCFQANEDGVFSKAPTFDFEAGTTAPDWYRVPFEGKASCWLESAPQARGNAQMAYIAPILLPNGVCIGIVGASCDISLIKNAAMEFSIFETGFAFLLNSDNSVLYHPNVPSGASRLEDRPEFEAIEGKDELADEDVELFSYRHNGERRYLSCVALRNGKKLCVSASRSEIFVRQSSLVLTTFFIIAVTICLTAIAATLFTRRLTRPITALNAAAREMLEGNLDTEIVATTADEIGELTRILNRARERLKFQISDLYNEAHHDGLTGIPNKTAFRDIEQKIDRQIAYGTASFVVAVLDVNRLKVTNDFFGHAAGDELLRSVGNHLKATFDPQSVFRIGGDEFALLLQGKNTEENRAIIERCVSKIPDIRLPHFPEVQVSCAIGIATYEKERDTRLNDTLLRADRLMYHDKGESKRRIALEGGKGIKQLQTEKFLEFLSVLNQSTEDYLFLYEIEGDKAHFFGKILERYKIECGEDSTVSMKQMADAIYPADRSTFLEGIREIIDGTKEEHDANYRLLLPDGNAVWLNCRGRVIKADDGQPFLLIGRLSDTILRPLYNSITGLFNRNRFLRDMQEQNAPNFSAFMLVDIDNMSNINLRLGRLKGDEALRLMTRALEESFPLHRIYHMEKDRFAVLLNTTDEEHIKERFTAMLSVLKGEFTASAAVVPYDEVLYADENSIYEYANNLLKESKAKKSGSIVFFTRDDFQKKISSIDLLAEMRQSIDNNFEGFFVVYQPKIAANGYTVSGAEALLRYRSPSRGVVSPAEFIPLLERTRLINKVGLFVCDTALRKCKEWRETIPNFRMAVNFSTIQLLEDETDERVLNMLYDHGLPGNALTIELTESIQLESAEVAEAFERFRAEGIHIAIDDFGTGYANLAYLKNIHADEIKIDRIFIKDIKESSYNFTVIGNILDFAKKNGFHVCLEGVETPEELSILESLGADTLQGYLFDKPIDPEIFIERYIENPAPGWSFIPELARYKEASNFMHFDSKYILSNVHVGLWVIHIDEERGVRKFYADDCMRELLGVDANTTPEECYAHWYSRIAPGHETVVNAMVKAMAEEKTVQQALYPWLHPTLGEVIFRCTGKCVRSENGVTVFEGFHRNLSELDNTYTYLEDKP